VPDLRVLVKLPTWNYTIPTASGVGVHFVPSEPSKTSWFHEHIDVAQQYMCNSVRPGTKRSYCTGENRWFVVVEKIGTDSLMRIIPALWVNRTDSLRMSSLT